MDSMNSCLFFAILVISMVMFCHACTNGEIRDNTVTQNNIKEIVNVHNKYRMQVASGELKGQPPAQNMQKMAWDDQLAARAQYWADQCVFKHDGGRGKHVGQNIYILYYGGPQGDRKHNFTEAITSWYSEHADFTYKPIEEVDFKNLKKQIGHYTQVVWAKTNRVGCGYASYYQTEKKRNEILYVCNYAPAGNFIGEYPYKNGKPDCKANGLSNSDVSGLCKK